MTTNDSDIIPITRAELRTIVEMLAALGAVADWSGFEHRALLAARTLPAFERLSDKVLGR